jgi:Tfp pilus assembly protein PilZ
MALQTAPNPPSARVRYRAPAVLTFDGFDETFHVTVTNLSAEGLGCDGPKGLVLGDQMRLTFALAQQQQPISVLCEVVWLTPLSDAAAYGMRFVSLDDAVRIQLEQATLTRSSAPQPVATTPLDIAAQATAVPQPQPADPSAPSATHTLEGLWGHTPAFRQEAAEQEQLWAKVRGPHGPKPKMPSDTRRGQGWPYGRRGPQDGWPQSLRPSIGVMPQRQP